MSRRLLLLLPAGAAVGLLAELAAFDLTDPSLWVPDLLVGWAFIGCGVVAGTRQRGDRSGTLMVATGFTWFLANFADVGFEFLAWVATHGIYLHRGPLVHLILAYPSGRASSRTTRSAVAVGYAAALVAPVWDNEAATLLLSALLVAFGVHEYRRAVGRYRRARLLALWAASGLGLVLAGGAVARLVLPSGEVSLPALLAYEVVLCAIAGGLLFGLITASWEPAEITDLVVELGVARSQTLGAALSRALGDPSLEVGYWFAEADAYVDAEGRVLSLPSPASDRSVTLVKHEDEPVAAIVHDPAVLDDPALQEAVAAATRLAAVNARLQGEVQARVAELEASRRRILDARDEEHRRLERRLHDGAERRLNEVEESLGRGRVSATSPATGERIIRAEEEVALTLEELRRLAQGLHPRALSEHGLERALESVVERFPVPVDIRINALGLSPRVEAATYFVCAEALANVAKHASASKVTVAVTTGNALATVVVEDDGLGGADPALGSGLRGLTDRIATLGGVLRVESSPTRGTRLTAEIPLGGERS